MGKHVVYIRARDERGLEAAGLDPGEWVRELVKNALDQMANGREGIAKPAESAKQAADALNQLVESAPPRKEVTPDFRSKDLK